MHCIYLPHYIFYFVNTEMSKLSVLNNRLNFVRYFLATTTFQCKSTMNEHTCTHMFTPMTRHSQNDNNLTASCASAPEERCKIVERISQTMLQHGVRHRKICCLGKRSEECLCLMRNSEQHCICKCAITTNANQNKIFSNCVIFCYNRIYF